MTDADLTELKSRIKQAVAEATAELAPLPDRAASSPSQCEFPLDHAWALVNVEYCRQAFVDRAIKRIGGKSFAVAVDSKVVTITRSDTKSMEAKAAVGPSKPTASETAPSAPVPSIAAPTPETAGHDASAPHVN